MGKSPLRLVTERTRLFEHCWLEKLECGHELEAFQQFVYGEGWAPITAVRRRCQKCKPESAMLSERERLSLKADKIWAGIVEYRKWYFGSLYEQIYDERGCLRGYPPVRIGAVAKEKNPCSPSTTTKDPAPVSTPCSLTNQNQKSTSMSADSVGRDRTGQKPQGVSPSNRSSAHSSSPKKPSQRVGHKRKEDAA